MSAEHYWHILLYEGASVDESSGMPRTSRASRGGFVYHVLNRGNGRSDVFHKDDDFAAFVNLMREAHEKESQKGTFYFTGELRAIRAS